MTVSARDINNLLIRIFRRAEVADPGMLAKTFVDTGSLFTLLGLPEHQVIYGRRGTGKTHALLYLAQARQTEKDLAVYIDLRTIGSSGGLYSDSSLPVAERATRLLIDTLSAIHDGLLAGILERNDEVNLARLGPLLDLLGESAGQVNVIDQVTEERRDRQEAIQERGSSSAATLSPSAIGGSLGASRRTASTTETANATTATGRLRHRVHFGGVGTALQRIADELQPRRLWILLDEWSVIPNELQPYLADLLRRSLFPVTGFVVKIGAIEQRSTFQLAGERGDYIGIELGADAAADVNLDDFMVFDNNAERATDFFKELIFRHVTAVADSIGFPDLPSKAAEFTRISFTQINTFEEFVRASEGVPRDAINILSLAAQRANDAPIAIEHIRGAAKTWYQRDKETAVSANPEARDFLHWIIQEVIAHRRARAFLLRTDSRHPMVEALFDARVLHLLKPNIAAHDQPGVRFNAYKIDYGCYVDLLTTARAPQGLLPAGEGADTTSFIDVPPDDYRAIRRAILDPERWSARE